MSLTDEAKEYIRQLDNATENKLKLWVLSAVLGQVLAFVPIIFFLGGIYSDGRKAVDILENQQRELEQRGIWMQERERWEMRMEDWAVPQGFKPSRYSRQSNPRGAAGSQ